MINAVVVVVTAVVIVVVVVVAIFSWWGVPSMGVPPMERYQGADEASPRGRGGPMLRGFVDALDR